MVFPQYSPDPNAAGSAHQIRACVSPTRSASQVKLDVVYETWRGFVAITDVDFYTPPWPLVWLPERPQGSPVGLARKMTSSRMARL